MPTFSLPVIALYSGDTYQLFASTDSLTAPAFSQVVTIGPSAGLQPKGIATWAIDFATSPTDSLIIYGSNTQPSSTAAQNGRALYTSTNTQHDSYTDNLAFTFYWCELVSQSGGGAVTVAVHVG
jgi:microcystin-dependent protein